MTDPATPIRAQPWRARGEPARVLAIRLQALGDVVVTLPYLRSLKLALPDTHIDFVTRAHDAGLPRAVRLFRHVDGVRGKRSERRQLLALTMLLPRLAARRYDVVLDLQNNRVSRAIRRVLAPQAWSAFDRHSPVSAGERTRRTIAAAGWDVGEPAYGLPLADPELGLDALRSAGWRHELGRPLVVLSPAGAFPSRNWPVERYARVAHVWSERQSQTPANAERQTGRPQFVVLGLDSLRPKAQALRAMIGDDVLDLAGRTTAAQALGIVQRATLVLTEDCGLMHMAWASGVPTLALFGSSPHVWSAPQGAHSRCLHSGDLPCGACMAPVCRYGNVHCLTRLTAEFVAAEAEQLLARTARCP